MVNVTNDHIAEPVLVTGACGFIGRSLISKLISTDHQQIIAFDLPGTKAAPDWQEKVTMVHGDITDRASLERAIAPARTIYHLAAVVSDWGPENFFWENTVEGSRNIFECAWNNRAQVVLASSIVVYGDKIGRQICREDESFGKPLGIYSRCKQAQEELAWEYHRNKKMALTVVRPANVYGPGSRPWVHDVVGVLHTGMPSLINGGRFNAGLVYVDNLSDLLLLAGARANAQGRIYNGCDDADITWERYFNDLAQIAGAPPPRSLPGIIARFGAFCSENIWRAFSIKQRPPITRESLNLVGSHHQISINRAKEELGFHPSIDYGTGIARVAEYWRQFAAAHD